MLQLTDATVDVMGKGAGLLDRLPIAGVAVLSLVALVWVYLARERDGREHRAELKALNDSHAKELAAVNEARLRLATEFEGTIRALLIAAKARARRPRRPELVAEKKE